MATYREHMSGFIKRLVYSWIAAKLHRRGGHGYGPGGGYHGHYKRRGHYGYHGHYKHHGHYRRRRRW